MSCGRGRVERESIAATYFGLPKREPGKDGQGANALLFERDELQLVERDGGKFLLRAWYAS